MKFGIFPVEGGDSWDGVIEQCQVVGVVLGSVYGGVLWYQNDP